MVNKRGGSERIEEINFLRGFGVLAVIAIHTTGYFTAVENYGSLVLVNLWADTFSQFAVPLFICISGFVLARKYRSKFPLKTFYTRRIRSIIPQYLIFSVLYTLVNNWDVILRSSPGACLLLLGEKIWQADGSYHLWFFAIIIELYILYPLIIKFYDFVKQIARAELALVFFLIVQLFWMVGVHATPDIKVNCIAYFFYFVLGIYACDYFEPHRQSLTRLTPLFLVMSLALTVGAAFFTVIGLSAGYRYYAIPGYYFMGSELIYPILRVVTFLFLFNLADILAHKRGLLVKILYRLGDHSFGIYLIHIFFTQSVISILKNDNIDCNNWLFYPIVYIVTLVVSYFAVRLLSYIPHSDYLIGQRGSHKSSGV